MIISAFIVRGFAMFIDRLASTFYYIMNNNGISKAK